MNCQRIEGQEHEQVHINPRSLIKTMWGNQLESLELLCDVLAGHEDHYLSCISRIIDPIQRNILKALSRWKNV